MGIKKFSLAGWYERSEYIYDFLRYYYDNSGFFFPDRTIDSLYDYYCYNNVPLLWSGGRVPNVIIDPSVTMSVILDRISEFPDIKLRHVFTNCLLDDPSLINDYRCNQFVKRYIRPQDEIIVNHPKLIEHLKLNYPNISLIYSTTIGLTDIDEVNRLSENNLVVLNYMKNNNQEYLDQLTHKNNVEFLCGEACVDNCPYKQIHYTDISRAILEGQLDYTALINRCYMVDNPSHIHGQNSLTYSLSRKYGLSNKRIDELSDQGFENFKISGRSYSVPEWIEIIIYYLALPEYKSKVEQHFLHSWW